MSELLIDSDDILKWYLYKFLDLIKVSFYRNIFTLWIINK